MEIEAGQAEIRLPVAEELPLLVMDDNAGLIELYRRYLAGRGYRVFDAHSADEVIATARQFAALLMANGAKLLEVPPHVIVSIVSGERSGSTTLN